MVVLLLLTLLSGLAIADDEALSREEQIRIIENYLYITGQTDEMPLAMSQSEAVREGLPIKCGTPAILSSQKMPKTVIS